MFCLVLGCFLDELGFGLEPWIRDGWIGFVGWNIGYGTVGIGFHILRLHAALAGGLEMIPGLDYHTLFPGGSRG